MWFGGLVAGALVLPFLAAGVAALLPTTACKLSARLATGAMALATLAAILLFPGLSGGEVHQLTVPWVPSLGLNFVLRVDGFAWLFLVLVCGIGALVCLYARYYMSPDDPVPTFFALLLAFAGSMIGLVLSGNVLQLVVFWEMTSILSFLLIGYWRHRPAREGARMALVVTSAGGLCLLAGMLMLGRIVGSFELSAILAAGDLIRAHPLYLPALSLILIGAFTKSAQFPFHFWLPQAMAAPTPVSAYLHSATMVKAGVFVLVRFWPVLAGSDAWFWMVAPIGLLTLLFGGYAAMFQNDLKGMLAYSTISHLGLITFLLGLNTAFACVAAIFHIVNHAMFKASLFMAAGAVDHETGTRDMRRLGGLGRFMPVTAAVGTIAAAAMAGVPLVNGFLSKEMFFDATWRAVPMLPVDASALVLALVVLGTIFSVAYSLKFVSAVFLGPPAETLPKVPHEPPAWMLVPIGLLALACLVVGIIPKLTVQPFLELAASSVLGPGLPYFSVAIWHGFVPALFMSIVALGGGVALFGLFRGRLLRGRTPVMGRLSSKEAFDRLYYFFGDTLPQRIEAAYPGDRLQPQLSILFVVALVTGLAAFGWRFMALPPPAMADADAAFAVLWVLGGACAVGAAATAKYRRVASLVLVGGAGLISCISFVWLSAPDLAMTQLLVEVVTTILLLLGLRWLPQREPPTAEARLADRLRRRRDLLIAVPAGLALALFAYGVMTHPVENTISRFFLRYSYLEGGGTNVVNVILVDFRAFDTLGEIAVLGIVALTVFALLRRFRPAPESIGAPVQQRGAPGEKALIRGRPSGDELPTYIKVPGMIVSLLAPVVLLFAVHLLLRGHNLPGGGFAAGLTTSVALILLYMAGGVRWIESRLAVNPVRWIGGGLLLALIVGTASFAFDVPFLTSYYDYLELPVIGPVPTSSAFLFDLGVFGLVVGATTLMLIALGHQSLRRPLRRAPAGAEGIN